MKKFIITEEEKKQILGLYEESQPQVYSQFTQDMAGIFNIPVESVTSLEGLSGNASAEKMREYQNIYQDQVKDINLSITKLARQGKIDDLLSMLKGYNKPMSDGQRDFLSTYIRIIETYKPTYEKYRTMPEDQWDKFLQAQSQITVNNSSLPENPPSEPAPTTQTTQAAGEKINTTNDRSYDYKLSGGKYYYSAKGQNNWIEAKGKGLEAIKSKVKF